MASTGVESQRLISLSLGKIAQSRCQKGGINLHKNLLVATVLHKARTACMMEYQTLQRQRQLEFQQRQQQQQKDAAVREFEQKQEQARSAALSLAAFNTSAAQNSPIPTCVREMEEEVEQQQQQQEASVAGPVAEVMTPTSAAAAGPVPLDSNLGQPLPACAGATALTLAPASVTEVGHSTLPDVCNKENSPPCLDLDEEFEFEQDMEETGAQVVPQSCPLDHLAAATQLAEDAAADMTSSRCSDQKPRIGSVTCNVLKRQRDNSGAAGATLDQECPPASKKARLVAARRDSCKLTNNTPDAAAASCDSDQLLHGAQHGASQPDSSQISNLVSIFNSGFSGLCPVSSQNCSSNNTSSSDYTAQAESHSLGSYSRKVSEPSLSCSSSLGRLDSLPSAIGLVLSV